MRKQTDGVIQYHTDRDEKMGERYTVNRERMMKDKMREEERNRERDRERETTVISKLDHTVMDLTILPQQETHLEDSRFNTVQINSELYCACSVR